MSDIKAIIFDCFGVLYPQAAGDFFEQNKQYFNRDPAALDKLNLQIDLGEIDRVTFFKGLEEASGIAASEIQNYIDSRMIYDSKLVEHITQLKDKYKIGLLSNAGKEEIEIIYRDKIDSLFDATTVSYEVGAIKPSAEIYQVCAKRLGAQPEGCVFIDDSKPNLEAAQAIGMKTIHYPKFGVMPNELVLLLD